MKACKIRFSFVYDLFYLFIKLFMSMNIHNFYLYLNSLSQIHRLHRHESHDILVVVVETELTSFHHLHTVFLV